MPDNLAQGTQFDDDGMQLPHLDPPELMDEDHVRRWIGADAVIIQRSFDRQNRRELNVDYDARSDEDLEDKEPF